MRNRNSRRPPHPRLLEKINRPQPVTYNVGQGVELLARPDLGVALVINVVTKPGLVRYYIEYPVDLATGLQSRREVLAKEVRAA